MPKIKHIALSTQDVDATAKFYIDVFGMKEIAKIDSPGARAVDLRDLLHAEHVDVELRSRVHVLGREGDVLDLRHGVSPVAMVRVRPLGLSGHTTPEGAETPGHSRPFVTAETGPCARSRRGI